MASNLAKCFICDVDCLNDDRNIGINIARRLTMPIASIFSKCLRTVVEADSEYFCTDCVIKIEDYDQLVQLSLQIETELYELYQRKITDPCYLLDAEIIDDPEATELIQSVELKMENESINETNSSIGEINETYDEMVVEYLDDFEAQSDDVNLADDPKIETLEEPNSGATDDASNENATPSEVAAKKPQRKRGRTKGSTSKAKTKTKEGKTTESPQSTDNEQLECGKCSFVAKDRLQLEEHKTIEHTEDVNRLVCDICGRSYKSKSALCVHLGTHNGQKANGTLEIRFFDTDFSHT